MNFPKFVVCIMLMMPCFAFFFAPLEGKDLLEYQFNERLRKMSQADRYQALAHSKPPQRGYFSDELQRFEQEQLELYLSVPIIPVYDNEKESPAARPVASACSYTACSATAHYGRSDAGLTPGSEDFVAGHDSIQRFVPMNWDLPQHICRRWTEIAESDIAKAIMEFFDIRYVAQNLAHTVVHTVHEVFLELAKLQKTYVLRLSGEKGSVHTLIRGELKTIDSGTEGNLHELELSSTSIFSNYAVLFAVLSICLAGCSTKSPLCRLMKLRTNELEYMSGTVAIDFGPSIDSSEPSELLDLRNALLASDEQANWLIVAGKDQDSEKKQADVDEKTMWKAAKEEETFDDTEIIDEAYTAKEDPAEEDIIVEREDITEEHIAESQAIEKKETTQPEMAMQAGALTQDANDNTEMSATVQSLATVERELTSEEFSPAPTEPSDTEDARTPSFSDNSSTPDLFAEPARFAPFSTRQTRAFSTARTFSFDKSLEMLMLDAYTAGIMDADFSEYSRGFMRNNWLVSRRCLGSIGTESDAIFTLQNQSEMLDIFVSMGWGHRFLQGLVGGLEQLEKLENRFMGRHFRKAAELKDRIVNFQYNCSQKARPWIGISYNELVGRTDGVCCMFGSNGKLSKIAKLFYRGEISETANYMRACLEHRHEINVEVLQMGIAVISDYQDCVKQVRDMVVSDPRILDEFMTSLTSSQ